MHQILREWAQAVFRGSYWGNCSQVEWRLRSLYIVARGAGAACLTAALVAKVDDIRETVLGKVSQIGGGTNTWSGGMTQFHCNRHTQTKGIVAPGEGALTDLGVLRSLGFVQTRSRRWGPSRQCGKVFA